VKRKKQTDSLLFRFWPSSAGSPPLALLFPHAARLPSLCFPLWAEPPLDQQAAWPASKRVAPSLPLSLWLMPRAHVSDDFFLPTLAEFLSLFHRSKSVSKSLLSFLGTVFGLYKSHAEPNRNHLVLFL
jgi:hypothetical protein